MKGKRSRPTDVSSSGKRPLSLVFSMKWFIDSTLIVSKYYIISYSAASGFWYQGSSQAHELTQMAGAAAEVQSKENQIACSLRQKDINISLINTTNSSSTRVQVEGRIWPSSPHLNVTSNLFSDAKSNKGVTAQSPLSGYANIASRPSDGPTRDRVEDGKKTENPLACWLFGVNLTNKSSSNVITPSEKELGCPSPTVVTSGPKESIPAAACETTERVQKQIISDASPNEWQNKQTSVPSMRTRTKVRLQPL